MRSVTRSRSSGGSASRPEAEPGDRPRIAHDALDRALEAVAEFADLKSPYTAGHSTGVAELAARAGAQAGLDDADVTRLLGAADVFHALTEPRPRRPAHGAEAATAEVRRQAKAGRLDGDAVEAVVAAAGGRTRRRAERGIRIVDVWDSPESLERFVKHPSFREALRDARLKEPDVVEVLPLHASGWPAAVTA